MITSKKVNDELQLFTARYGTPPTTIHLSEEQQRRVVIESAEQMGRTMDPRQHVNLRSFGGIDVRTCKHDGPSFSAVVD